MMHITLYLDLITVVMAVIIILSAFKATNKRMVLRFLCGTAAIFYLYAQTGWAAAYVSGNIWGAIFNNYIWFLFNFTVFCTLFVVLKEKK
jgi:hypothetical protein